MSSPPPGGAAGTFTSVTSTSTRRSPDLRTEKRLLRSGHERVACIDEVGRGALAGPVTVGVVVVDPSVRRPLSGVRDSKLLTPAAREALVPRIRRWTPACSVAHASAAEIDDIGLTSALRLAAHRAVASMEVSVDVVLLDGSHDWFTPPRSLDLFQPPDVLVDVPPVVTSVKADMRCAGVAAASVLAKTERDALMCALAVDHPEYGWDENKGYSSPSHIDALRRSGPCAQHRRSWRLPD